jgi:hypothetical protein
VTRQLVLVHGRAQQHKDAAELKRTWIDAWSAGLSKSGLSVPIEESAIRFPYYGDTLAGLVAGGDTPDVIVKGPEPPREERDFLADVLEEARQTRDITDDRVSAQLGEEEVLEKGAQNWPWVRAIARALDSYLPGASGATLAAVTYDVYCYLRNPGVRDVIEEGVRAAISSEGESVVVGHSLGTVVTYNLLRREGRPSGWKVPLYVTVGSPLAVTAIRKALQPIQHPSCAHAWFNALDKRDIVALYPLRAPYFDIDPAVENKTDIDNHTDNRHGIAGYLDDRVVARRIHDALTEP